MFQIIKQACDAETNKQTMFTRGTNRIQRPQIVWRSVLLTLNQWQQTIIDITTTLCLKKTSHL